MKVSGKVLAVTGAGNGVGRAVSLEALRRGARIAAVDVSASGLDETRSLAAAGDRLSTHLLDITDRTAVAGLPAQVASAHGNVDGLIHLAAIIQPFEKVKDLDDAVIERVINVNWWGTLYLDRAFLPVLLERPEGHIVNTSSMGGFIPVPGQTIYGGVKGRREAPHRGAVRGMPGHPGPRDGRDARRHGDEHAGELWRLGFRRSGESGRHGEEPHDRRGGCERHPRWDGTQRVPRTHRT